MNLTVKEAAKLMNKSEQFIRIGLQRNILPIGNAVLNPGGKYSYYISPELFEKYTGIKVTKKENIKDDQSQHSL